MAHHKALVFCCLILAISCHVVLALDRSVLQGESSDLGPEVLVVSKPKAGDTLPPLGRALTDEDKKKISIDEATLDNINKQTPSIPITPPTTSNGSNGSNTTNNSTLLPDDPSLPNEERVRRLTALLASYRAEIVSNQEGISKLRKSLDANTKQMSVAAAATKKAEDTSRDTLSELAEVEQDISLMRIGISIVSVDLQSLVTQRLQIPIPRNITLEKQQKLIVHRNNLANASAILAQAVLYSTRIQDYFTQRGTQYIFPSQDQIDVMKSQLTETNIEIEAAANSSSVTLEAMKSLQSKLRYYDALIMHYKRVIGWNVEAIRMANGKIESEKNELVVEPDVDWRSGAGVIDDHPDPNAINVRPPPANVTHTQCPQPRRCCYHPRSNVVYYSSTVHTSITPHESLPHCHQEISQQPAPIRTCPSHQRCCWYQGRVIADHEVKPDIIADPLYPTCSANDIARVPTCPKKENHQCCVQNGWVWYNGEVQLNALPHPEMKHCG